jgi:hypothetical protein
MPHFGQKTGFRARNAGMYEIKSGIPCSGHGIPAGARVERQHARALADYKVLVISVLSF